MRRILLGRIPAMMRSERGEVTSWLMAAAGLCMAAFAAIAILSPTILGLASNVGSGAVDIAAGAPGTGGDPATAPGDPGDGGGPGGDSGGDSGDTGGDSGGDTGGDSGDSGGDSGGDAGGDSGGDSGGDTGGDSGGDAGGDSTDPDDAGRPGVDDRQVPDRGDVNDGVDGRPDDRDPREDGRPTGPDAGDASTGSPGTTSDPTTDAQGLPDAPEPPAQPATGDGSGDHGSDDGIRARIAAELTETLAYRLADAADAIGLDNASKNMRHYLDNSGEDLFVDPAEIMRDVPQFEDAVSDTIEFDLRAQIDGQIAENWDGEAMSFQVTSDWEGFYLGKGLSQDWFFALGGISYAVGAEVTVTPGPDGTPQVSVSYQTHIFDRYNWDGGKSVTIGPVTINDEQLGQLHEVGIAQEYEVYGTTEAQEYSYEYDPAGSTPTTEIDPSNGDGR